MIIKAVRKGRRVGLDSQGVVSLLFRVGWTQPEMFLLALAGWL